MSKSKQKARRPRRLFSDEYKAEVVALIENGNKSFSQVCKDLGLTDSVVRRWVRSSKDSSLKSTFPGLERAPPTSLNGSVQRING